MTFNSIALKICSVTQAQTLVAESQHGWLDVSGLESIDDAVAEVLATHEGELALNGIVQLTDKAAEYLGRHSGSLYLKNSLLLMNLKLSLLQSIKAIWCSADS